MAEAAPTATGCPAREGTRFTEGARALALAAGCLLAAAAGAAQEQPSLLSRALGAFNETTPVGLLAPGERRPGWKGAFADLAEGSRRNFRDGDAGLILPFFTLHPAYKYPNRSDNNNYPFGVGYTRSLIDAKDNERMVFALAFSDSHYDFQPVVGWSWIARWPLADGVKGGLGYSVFVTARADANYIPFPAILPLASIGTDRLTFYGAWIPTTEVLWFFARVTLPQEGSSPPVDSGTRASAPFGAAAAGARGGRGRLLYAGGGLVNTDASGIDSVASGNAWAPLAGYRHLSVSKSTHTLDLGNARLGEFDLTPIGVAAQYHLPAYRGVRMYAGAGVAYNRITAQKLPGYSLSRDGFSPLLRAGADLRLGDAWVLTGGLSVNFGRNQLYRDGALQGTVKLSPVTFGLTVGYEF